MQNEIKREVAQEALVAIVGDTPVDTGRARDSWNVSVRAPVYTVPQGAYTRQGGRTRGGLGAIAKGRSVIRSAAVKYGVPLYIASGLSYMVYLNQGRSSQAPRSFVLIAIARARGIVRRQVKRYGADIFK